MPLTEEPELVYELRTYTAHEGKLDALEQRFRNHTMALFEKHGIIKISNSKPLDQPNTLIYLLAHPSQFSAATAWQALMLEMICPLPSISSVPSLRTTICGVCSHI